MRHRLSAVLILVLVLAGLAPAQPLPTDPRLVMGELENGLRYIVRRHSNPPGRAAIWLHVSSGSLNETDGQRGLAHFLEHMAFNGSEHFPPGTVVPLFESLGLTFGHDQNAFTSFDQTVYMLALPDTEPETLTKGLTFLSDVAMRLTFPRQEIDNERQVILEERTARLGSVQRVQDYCIENLAPGSLLGRRIPIGTEEAIKSVTQQDFRDYYSRWYVPSDLVVMVVADMGAPAMVERIRTHFSGGPRQPGPRDKDPGLKPYERNRAIVAADPELTSAEVGLNWLSSRARPIATVADYRDRLVEGIGNWIFNRRLQRKIAERQVAFDSGGADVSDLFSAGRLAHMTVRGEPAGWRQMLTDLASESRRARLHGFTEDELADAKKEIQAGAERALETDPTRPADAILRELNTAVANGDALTSAQQDLTIIKSLLPEITLADAAGRFNQNFDTSKPLTFVLQIPSTAEVPTEAQLVELGMTALMVEPGNEAPRARAAALLDKVPEPVPIADLIEDPASGVWSAWLANGVRLHYRFMDYRKDQVQVVITLAGGEIRENASNRGIAAAAAMAWARPAAGRLSSTDIEDLMTGKKAETQAMPGTDAFTLGVRGAPAEIETGMQLAYLLLTEPVVETAAFEQWKDAQKREIAGRKLDPQGVFRELLSDTLYPPGEARLRPLEVEHVQRLSAEGAQRWLRQLCATAPIEVAIVGDLDKDRALDLAQRYLGNLSARERIGDKTLDELREVRPKPGPLEASRQVRTRTEQAIAMSGFFGASFADLEDVRLLNMATQILTTRANLDIREKRRLAYSPGISSAPGVEYPHLGLVGAVSATSPGTARELLAAFDELFAAFSADGPNETEMETARKQFANMDQQMREPRYWAQSLSSLDYRGRTLASIREAPEAYQSFTGEQVKAGFNKYYKPEARFRLWVTPAANDAAIPPAPPSLK